MKQFSFALSLCLLIPLASYGQLPCELDTTNLMSLVDMQDTVRYLETPTFEGYEGGLYPGGSNEIPIAHKRRGIQISKTLLPLDTLGNVDFENGKVVFAGLGASTAGNTWNHFVDKVESEPGINPCLQVVNGCQGAKGLEIMIDTANLKWYWYENVLPKLYDQGVTPEQVQAIWIRSASKEDTIMEFPLFPNAIADKYAALMPILQDTFPNIKLAFVSGFFYGGYADTAKAFYDVVVEPGSYWTNYSVKWLVERQISGDTTLVYRGADRKSPWIGWGPHTWSDGTRANTYDSLFWDCELDFAPDGGGYHLTNAGKDKDSDLMMEWAKTNPVTKRWFLDNPFWTSCDGSGRLSSGEDLITDSDIYVPKEMRLFPSPNQGVFTVQFGEVPEGLTELNVYNSFGQQITSISAPSITNGGTINVQLQDVPNGMYLLEVLSNEAPVVKQFTVTR